MIYICVDLTWLYDEDPCVDVIVDMSGGRGLVSGEQVLPPLPVIRGSYPRPRLLAPGRGDPGGQLQQRVQAPHRQGVAVQPERHLDNIITMNVNMRDVTEYWVMFHKYNFPNASE